ncbi:MAG: Fe-S cluster assembly scaffold protein NifU [Anaerolineae bacterium]|nr:Fe-S cluster assembly scaffold protein NifU [Anaerolineae bacterium]
MKYSDKVIEHFTNPRNVGVIENADGVGKVGNPVCGDMMEMSIKIENDVITDIKFRTFGCGAAIATSSIATELIMGRTIDEALELTNQAIAEALGGLPPIKMHCSVLAADALKSALADYYRRKGDWVRAREMGGDEEDETACPIIPEDEQVPLKWSNLELIAEQLAKGYLDLNPLDLSIPNLFRRLLSLPGFDDDPDVATEEMLEKIQMLWHEQLEG